MLHSFDACWLSRFHCWFEESSSSCNSLNVLLCFKPKSQLFIFPLSALCASSCLLTVTSKLHPQMPISICLSISPCFPFHSDQSERQTRIECLLFQCAQLGDWCHSSSPSHTHALVHIQSKGRVTKTVDTCVHLCALSSLHCDAVLWRKCSRWVTLDHLTHD